LIRREFSGAGLARRYLGLEKVARDRSIPWGALLAEAGSTHGQCWQRRGRMRWKISIEGSDEITRGHRFEFETKKSLDDLIAGNIGLSINEGKAIMASLQRHIIVPSLFCSDFIARGVAERGRSRITRREQSRQFTALSP
jgi:hypothetical protein